MPSTVIRRFAYEEETLRLTVTFVTGRVYEYAGVPSSLVEAFRAASSKGAFFNRAIRDHFPYRELPSERPAA